MKKIFILSMLMPLALICSCGRQDSTAEQRLVQRKVELDTRENALAERDGSLDARETALNEREKALTEREKALTARERAMASSRVKPADVQPQGAIRDAAQAKAERDRKIQQLPPEMRALITQGGPEQLQGQRQRKLEAMQKSQISHAATSPATAATSPPSLAVYPQPEATSPTPSPATTAASPSPSPTPQ